MVYKIKTTTKKEFNTKSGGVKRFWIVFEVASIAGGFVGARCQIYASSKADSARAEWRGPLALWLRRQNFAFARTIPPAKQAMFEVAVVSTLKKYTW